MLPSWVCVVLLGVLEKVSAAPEEDWVTSLPGWNRPLFSKTYAGYIEVGSKHNTTKMFEHYLYFESEHDPETDPLIMWTNGGPGASSFFGSFSELGPYALSEASLYTDDYKKTGVPTLFENVHRWTKLGNLLIRNLPPPIGFSYCEPAGPSGDGYSCGPWTDTEVAVHSFNFLNNWITKAFPELQSRRLFLVGESYAGVYVPMLAMQITNVNPGSVLNKMLAGVAVGDGCVTGLGCVLAQGPYFDVEFFYGHGQYSTKTYKKIHQVCSKEELWNGPSDNTQCKDALNQMDLEKGYVFAYNLYDECYDFALLGASGMTSRKWSGLQRFGGPAVNGLNARRASKAQRRAELEKLKVAKSVRSDPIAPWHMDGSPCGGTDVLPDWVNTLQVKEALHVAKDAVFFTGDNGVGFTYNGNEPYDAIFEWYKQMAARNQECESEKKVRMLIYNGDTDPSLNSFFGEYWTSQELGLVEKESWRPWTHNNKLRMGGFVTRYKGDFDYLTIRGSGHMVPEYKPEAASVMLGSWLLNKDYPVLNKTEITALGEIIV